PAALLDQPRVASARPIYGALRWHRRGRDRAHRHRVWRQTPAAPEPFFIDTLPSALQSRRLLRLARHPPPTLSNARAQGAEKTANPLIGASPIRGVNP